MSRPAVFDGLCHSLQRELIQIFSSAVRRTMQRSQARESAAIAQDALQRFIYLGDQRPVIICGTPHLPDTVAAIEQLHCIRQLLTAPIPENRGPAYPLGFIRRALSDPLLTRRTEAIAALAYCVRCVDSEPLRQLVYTELPELLRTDAELFEFVHLANKYKLLGGVNNNPGQPEQRGARGFGRGMRRAISAWYQRHTADELVTMVGRNRGQLKWTHCDLLAMCHVPFEPSDQRLWITQALQQRGVRILQQLADKTRGATIERTAEVDRLMRLLQFKCCEDTDEAVKLYVANGFGLDNVPSHLRASVEFWSAVRLQNLPLADLLRVLTTLDQQRPSVLWSKSPEAESLIADFCMLLRSKEVVQRRPGAGDPWRKVQPLQLLSAHNAFVAGVAPANAVKAQHVRRKRSKLESAVGCTTPVGDVRVADALKAALELSFVNVPEFGDAVAELYVTLDLRAGAHKRRVFNMEHVSCHEAMVTIALALVKRAPTVVFAYNGNDKPTGVLRQVDLRKDDTLEEAMEKCAKASSKKTIQTLESSLRYSLDRRTRAFITIMDSAARICRQGLTGFAEFEKIREIIPDSRYVMMNLGRHTHDLHSYPGKGVLEICGLQPNVLHIVNAFITNRFK